ncbi:MAG: SpoIIE family protein phosphatase [candidate division Zixibacteria bacterium]|nr:SpoIIE family protein phosphatase [candidate division Zixibacteria bacterium]
MNKNLEQENLELKRAVEELSVLNEISAAIGSSMKVEEITKLIISKCIKKIGVEQGAVTLLKDDSTDAFKTFIRVIDKSMDNIPYRLGVNLAGWMFKNQKPLLINNIATDERFTGMSLETGKIKSILSVPLKVKNKLIGLLSLFNKKGDDFNAEDMRLLSIIAMQSAQTIENARLYEEERKLLVLEEDLRTAKNIQLSLLPKENPRIPGIDIAGVSLPARDVGGDYFDFIPIDDRHLGIAVGDVSGKGTSAALLMANLQASLRGQALVNQSVKDTVTKINFMLSRFIDRGKFITLFYGILDIKDKTFTYSNAGHDFPFLLSKNSDLQTLEKGGIILGMFDNSTYEEETVQLKPDDLMLLYTDGITEATNEKDEMFEEEKLLKLLKDNQSVSAQELSQKIVDNVLSFQGTSPQGDDITLVVVKV